MDKLEKNTSSPELLVELLNEEINRLDSFPTRSGINPWILLAAFAAIIWMIFPKVYDYSANYLDLILPFLLLYVFHDLITYLINTLKPNDTNGPGKTGRFQLTNINIGGDRHSILLELIKVGIIITMISYISNIYKSYGIKLLYIPYSMIALFLPLMFVLSFFEFPLSLKSGSKNKIATILIILIFILCLSVGSWFLIEIGIQNKPSMISWQISGSFLVISIIIGLLAKSNRESSPLLNSLIDLRRDIILNKISFESALNQTDIVFSGLSISHLLQDEVEKILVLQRQISKLLHTIANEYEATKNAAINNPDDKCTLCSSLTRSVKSYTKEVKSLTIEFTKKYKKLTFRSHILLSMSSSTESSVEFNKLKEKISHNREHIVESLNLVEDKINSFKKDLNCTEEIKQIAECK